MTDSITIDKYVTELKQKSKDCEFGSTESDMIRDKIAFSISDQRLKERLLRETNLTLEKTVDICRAAEAAENATTLPQCACLNKKTKSKHERNVTIDSLFIGSVEINEACSSVQKAWYMDVDTGNTTVKFKLDSGAEAKIMPLNIFRSLHKTALLQPTSTMLVAYGGQN
ncbi:hypothetical protein QQF64_033952 [Cirrhinus molitorella]|uniref:Peptidase A2 domain-containing protein n=1 Tax=Cirrhinus molitorella TaxID=172907 RepID=A0ABR3MVF1_9TELE